jgi:hypothetical protein
MTTAELLELATRVAGQALSTATGKRFTVSVDGNWIIFTPASTGVARSGGPGGVARFVERYNRTSSLRPADYQDITRNSSYYTALARAGGYLDRA